MNPRKLLALLGPRSPSLTRLMHQAFGLVEGGGHGEPVTAQDVAGALGFIDIDPRDRPLALGLYCLLWFPGYDNRQRRHDVTDALALRLGGEYTRRAQLVARIDVRRRTGRALFPPPPKRWAADPAPMLWALAETVIDELQHRHDCETCKGFGMMAKLVEGGGWKAEPCEACLGQGVRDWSARMRAKRVQIRRWTFERHLHAPYVWLLAEARHLEQLAAGGHYEALRD